MKLILIFVIVAAAVILYNRSKKKNNTSLKPGNLPQESKDLLEKNVRFYQKLDPAQKLQFEARLLDFLQHTTITGIGAEVTELDRLLVASSAIIPIFAFPDWRYNNIDEVLLYPTSFNKEYETGDQENVLGMVGNGAMQRQMILSQPALRSGFMRNDRHNTGIHEFVHLLDKADGATDGIPEYLLEQPYIVPWLKQMHQEITAIRSQHSEIDLYGGTNDTEFFAVISEYFFEKPQELKEHHPNLYAMLEQMFKTEEVFNPGKNIK
ncbi:zinc-dependent peptidase [Chitinophagaceae bacterium MMS25-I14]